MLYKRSFFWLSNICILCILHPLVGVAMVPMHLREGGARKNQVAITNYGVKGHLFEIEEPSLLGEIMEKLSQAEKNGKLEQLQEEFNRRVREKVLRPTPVENIVKAQQNRSWTYDPTYQQDTDIVDARGRVIVAAGTRVNALNTMQWGEPLLFIDGEDQDQIEWAKQRPGKIILIKGAPLQVSEQLERTVYFDQGGIYCNKFKIEAVPAIIEQEDKLLRIREVKL